MSNKIKQVQHDEYHELTLGERIGYGIIRSPSVSS